MKKKTKKMIMKVVKRSARILICGLLIMTQILPVYASISASDGMGVVTKLEFESVMADFNSRVAKFEMGINSKIENEVNTYLSKMDLVGAKGYVINDETEITGTKNATTGVYTDVTAIAGVEIANLKVGDNIYIRDNNSYDYWVSQISPTVSLSVLNQKIDISNYQKDIISNVTGTAGEVLARNSTNNGLEFVAKQDVIIDTISGNANQALVRNASNNGLEFKTITVKYNYGVIGEIFAYGGSGTPAGCLLCDGQYYTRTSSTYVNLYNVIGTSYGYSNSTNFRVPNLTEGRYLKGSSTNGSYTNSHAPNIKGTLNFPPASWGSTSIEMEGKSGAFDGTTTVSGQWTSKNGGNSSLIRTIDFNASKYGTNSVYSDSYSNIEPDSLSQRFYIRYAYDVRTATITLS